MGRIGHKSKVKKWCVCGQYEKTAIGDLCARCFEVAHPPKTMIQKLRDGIMYVQEQGEFVKRMVVGSDDYIRMLNEMNSFSPNPISAGETLHVYGTPIELSHGIHNGRFLIITESGNGIEYEPN